MTDDDEGVIRSMVLLPSRTTAAADGASETAVSDMVMLSLLELVFEY
jgi:hypothetical protein